MCRPVTSCKFRCERVASSSGSCTTGQARGCTLRYKTKQHMSRVFLILSKMMNLFVCDIRNPTWSAHVIEGLLGIFFQSPSPCEPNDCWRSLPHLASFWRARQSWPRSQLCTCRRRRSSSRFYLCVPNLQILIAWCMWLTVVRYGPFSMFRCLCVLFIMGGMNRYTRDNDAWIKISHLVLSFSLLFSCNFLSSTTLEDHVFRPLLCTHIRLPLLSSKFMNRTVPMLMLSSIGRRHIICLFFPFRLWGLRLAPFISALPQLCHAILCQIPWGMLNVSCSSWLNCSS